MNIRLLASALLPLLLIACGPSEEQVALARKVIMLEARVAELGVDNSRLGSDLASAHARIENTSALAAIARADVVARDAALSQAAVDVDALRAQLAAAGEQTDVARQRARMLSSIVSETRQTLQARQQSLRAELRAGAERIAELGARLAESDGLAHRLQAELRSLRALHEKDGTTAAALAADLNARLQATLDRNRYLIALLETEREACVSERGLLEQALSAAQASASELGAHLAAATSLNYEIERSAVGDAASVDENNATDAAATPARVRSLQRQLDAARSRSEQLLGAIDSCQRELREQSRATGDEPLATVPSANSLAQS